MLNGEGDGHAAPCLEHYADWDRDNRGGIPVCGGAIGHAPAIRERPEKGLWHSALVLLGPGPAWDRHRLRDAGGIAHSRPARAERRRAGRRRGRQAVVLGAFREPVHRRSPGGVSGYLERCQPRLRHLRPEWPVDCANPGDAGLHQPPHPHFHGTRQVPVPLPGVLWVGSSQYDHGVRSRCRAAGGQVMSALHQPTETLSRRERIVLNLYAITGLAVFVLMMLGGIAMRMSQGTWIELPPDIFYQIMTAHGAAMVGIAGLTSSAVMWYFLRKYVSLSPGIFLANYVLFMIGAVLILGSIFILQFGGGWTFLYPLPVKSNGMWSVHAAAGYMLGLISIGVGFLLFYLDATLAILRVYGNLGRALGLQWLFSGAIDKSHPPTVVASTMVIIVNGIGTLVGAVVLVLCLGDAYVPAFELNPLLAKNK